MTEPDETDETPGASAAAAVDLWWREIGTTALLGTARRPVPALPAFGSALASPGPTTTSREQALLDAAALGGAALRAGRRLDRAGVATESDVAPAEVRPVAPPRAVQLLELVLTQPPAGATQRTQLLRHWLDAARRATCRVPPGLLPRLLDLASAVTDLRAPVADVAGERGRWLAGLRPEWRWAADSGSALPRESAEPAPLEWARLPSAARLAALAARRVDDPAAARELVRSTWASDPVRDRRAHLDTLRIGLGPGDEPLLEQALDDRAATVRELAAELLDALPDSARAARMADRLRPLVRRTGLLGHTLVVELPGEPDAAAVRDGIGRPPQGRSARGWWLEQLCAGSPLSVWSEIARADPAATVRRLDEPDALSGIRRAVIARRDARWAAALLERGFDPALLAALPRTVREQAVLDRVPAIERPYEIATVLGTLTRPWTAEFSVALVARLRAAKLGSALVSAAQPHLLRDLHAAALAPVEQWIAASGADPSLNAHLRTLLQLHSTQRAIDEAFR